MVLSWLLNSMSKNLLSSVIYLNTAHEVWTDLKSRLSQGNRPRVFELRRMVSNLSQDNLFVSSYYTKFKIAWDELANYKSIPSCSCGVCTCGSVVASAQYQKEECTMNFLMGLNEAFATVRGQILLMEPLYINHFRTFSFFIQSSCSFWYFPTWLDYWQWCYWPHGPFNFLAHKDYLNCSYNGESILVTHIGQVQLSIDLVLDNVLCLPSFSFNLISISKLTHHLRCCCIFPSNFCFIQDLVQWKTIELSRKHGGSVHSTAIQSWLAFYTILTLHFLACCPVSS